MSPRLVAVPLPLEAPSLEVIREVWAAGDAVLPLDPRSTERERTSLLARLRPAALSDGSSEVALDDPVPVAEGTALVIATSGTTGIPKGVVLGHGALETAARLTNEQVGAAAGQRWLCCLPLSHIAGLMTVLRSWDLGSEAVIHPRFEIEAIRSEKRASFVSVVPTMLYRLLAAGVDLSHFDRILVGGAAVDDELIERARTSGARVTVTYGMTETSGGVVYDGVPLPGVGIETDDDGRISLATPTLMDGYRLDDAATDHAVIGGRFVTEDLGAWDDHGRLRVLGRIDRTIITGGKNVSPGEVEEALMGHPEVLEASVRGEPDEHWGQRVVADVVPRDPKHPPTGEDLTAFLRERISHHKVPNPIRVLDR